MTDGVISSEDLHRGYLKEAVALSHQVLDSDVVQVVSCTVASCLTPNLYKEIPETKTVQWLFKTTTVFLDEAGTASRPDMMMLVMASPNAKRFAMAGDPLQPLALVSNPETRNLWPSSYLQDECIFLTSIASCFSKILKTCQIMKRKSPSVMLGVQCKFCATVT